MRADQQLLPQTRRPSGQVVASPAAQDSMVQPPPLHWHWAVSTQATVQLSMHLMSQTAESLQVTVLPVPRSSLQLAVPPQMPVERAPALSSHLDSPTHDRLLSSPALPLQSELSMQDRSTAPEPATLHLPPLLHSREHDSQVALQSLPAVHTHESSASQLHPAPVHAAGTADESLPQPQNNDMPASKLNIISFFLIRSY